MEPPSAIVEDPLVKRILAYPIDVQASAVILPGAPPPSGDMQAPSVSSPLLASFVVEAVSNSAPNGL
jgi:hypothetical protein